VLAIEGSLEKARYIGGFPAEGNHLSYMIKLLLRQTKYYCLLADKSAAGHSRHSRRWKSAIFYRGRSRGEQQ
jgi:hypothetical protein